MFMYVKKHLQSRGAEKNIYRYIMILDLSGSVQKWIFALIINMVFKNNIYGCFNMELLHKTEQAYFLYRIFGKDLCRCTAVEKLRCIENFLESDCDSLKQN